MMQGNYYFRLTLSMPGVTNKKCFPYNVTKLFRKLIGRKNFA